MFPNQKLPITLATAELRTIARQIKTTQDQGLPSALAGKRERHHWLGDQRLRRAAGAYMANRRHDIALPRLAVALAELHLNLDLASAPH